MASLESDALDIASKQAPSVPIAASGGMPVPDMSDLLKGMKLPSFESFQKDQKAYDEKVAAAQKPMAGKAMSELDQMKEPPQPQIPEVPQKPDAEYKNALNVFKSWVPAVAMLGSAFSKHPLMNAMKSAGAAMQGYNEGNQQKVELQLKKWQDAMEAWKAEHDRMDDMRKWVMENNKFHADRFEAYAAATKNPTLLGVTGKAPEDMLRTMLDYEKASAEMIKAHAEVIKARGVADNIMDDPTLRFLAEQRISGDKSADANLGRGTQGAQNITRYKKMLAEVAREKGLSGTDLARIDQEFMASQAEQTSAARAIGTKGTVIELSSNLLNNSLPILKDAFAKVDNSKFKDINSFENYFKDHTNNPDLAALNEAILNTESDLALLMRRGGASTVDSAVRAEKIINNLLSSKSFDAVENQILKESTAAKEAERKTRDTIMGKAKDDDPNRPLTPEEMQEYNRLKNGQ